VVTHMDANLLKGHLDLILLSILEQGEMYGVEITREAQQRTDGYFNFSIGSLYPALHRLEQAGWIKGEFRLAKRGAPVKYYALTENGLKILAEKRHEFDEFTLAVRSLWTIP
jgi:PadR family transcriptional regulator, regulatory protein PadR